MIRIRLGAAGQPPRLTGRRPGTRRTIVVTGTPI